MTMLGLKESGRSLEAALKRLPRSIEGPGVYLEVLKAKL
jgi:hypothetical protein